VIDLLADVLARWLLPRPRALASAPLAAPSSARCDSTPAPAPLPARAASTRRTAKSCGGAGEKGSGVNRSRPASNREKSRMSSITPSRMSALSRAIPA
jgi:hypothetical protein